VAIRPIRGEITTVKDGRHDGRISNPDKLSFAATSRSACCRTCGEDKPRAPQTESAAVDRYPQSYARDDVPTIERYSLRC
jgi:hypothetical protein